MAVHGLLKDIFNNVEPTLLFNGSFIRNRPTLIILVLLYRMIESDSETTPESKKVHMDNLYRVVQYCENVTDCRRAQLLHYFGETTFDAKDCINNEQTVCDNCESSGTCTVRDCTAISKLIVKGIKDVVHGGNGNRRSSLENKLTMNHFIDIFMVSSTCCPSLCSHSYMIPL